MQTVCLVTRLWLSSRGKGFQSWLGLCIFGATSSRKEQGSGVCFSLEADWAEHKCREGLEQQHRASSQRQDESMKHEEKQKFCSWYKQVFLLYEERLPKLRLRKREDRIPRKNCVEFVETWTATVKVAEQNSKLKKMCSCKNKTGSVFVYFKLLISVSFAQKMWGFPLYITTLWMPRILYCSSTKHKILVVYFSVLV